MSPDTPEIDLSVVIVSWNTRDYLLDVVASLIETTTRTAIEIIVVDNASHDDSQEALRERFPEVTLICNTENLGFAKANNIGFSVARGQAFCLVNTDVIVLPGAIDRLWEYMKHHPTVGMVGPRQRHRDGTTRQNVRRFPSLANTAGDYLWLKRLKFLPGRALPPETYDHCHTAEVLSGAFLMVRRQACDEVGALDEDFFFYGEDTDWAKRFYDAGWQTIYYPEAEVIHFGGGSSAAYPVKYYLAMEKADYLYWSKHHSRLERVIYMSIKFIYHFISLAGWVTIWLTRPKRRELASLKVRGNLATAVWLSTRRSLA